MTQPTGLEPFAFLATNESHDSFSFTFDRVGSVLDAQQIYKICEKLGNISDVNIDLTIINPHGKVLAAALSQFNSLEKISFTGAGEYVGEFLEQINCPSVTDVEFISCHLPSPQILRILPKNLPNIQKLILTQSYPKHTLDFESFIVNTMSLRELSMIKNKIGVCTCLKLAEAMKKKISLQTLRISSCQTNEHSAAIIKMLRKNESLTELWLNDTGLKDAASECTVLATNRTLRKLVLKDNTINDHGLRHISFALAENKALTELNLARNHITLNGIKLLARCLLKNRTLTHLNIIQSSSGSAQHILKANAQTKSLRFLAATFGSDTEYLSENTSLTGLKAQFKSFDILPNFFSSLPRSLVSLDVMWECVYQMDLEAIATMANHLAALPLLRDLKIRFFADEELEQFLDHFPENIDNASICVSLQVGIPIRCPFLKERTGIKELIIKTQVDEAYDTLEELIRSISSNQTLERFTFNRHSSHKIRRAKLLENCEEMLLNNFTLLHCQIYSYNLENITSRNNFLKKQKRFKSIKVPS